jgi:hypothetical protein
MGNRESLNKDYVVFLYSAKGVNDKDAGPKLQEFLRMGYRHSPVNAGPSRVGGTFFASPQKIIERIVKTRMAYLVFDDRNKVESFLKDVVKADFGLSVIVSGLFDEVDEICQTLGIKRHTVQCSLGVWGRIDRLPQQEILAVNTMCGHGMVSFNLVKRMAYEVSKGHLSYEEAGRTLARPCVCGVFNPKRAEELLRTYITKQTAT